MTETEAVSEPRGWAKFTQFSRHFWFINGVELLERGAYYSLSAVLTVYMIATFTASGMARPDATSLAGLLGGILFLLLYLVPLIAAAIAEKIGYKVSLIAAFAVLTAGYVTMFGIATTVPLVILGVVLIGVGAGIFKPIAAALVSQTTTETQRNFAFAIYYGCINIGAFLFPVTLGLIAGSDVALSNKLAFGTAAILVAANLALCIFVFRNLSEPDRSKNVFSSLASIGEVFKYPAFLGLVAIYTGFWFMYVMGLTFINQYMLDYHRMPATFNPLLLQSINPLVIIVFSPLIGIFATRYKAVSLMMVGIATYAFGFIVLGFSTIPTLFITGVVIYSFGELLTHPSYLAYVSKIAPREKVAVFLGYSFIPIGVGQFFGSSLGGKLYGSLGPTQPQLFWAIMAAVGFATVAALAIYNWVLARKIREAEPAPARRGPVGAFLRGPGIALVALLLIAGFVFAGAIAPKSAGVTTASVTGNAGATGNLVKLADITGTTQEKKTSDQKITIPANATGGATFVLTWKDEADAAPATNQPDKFRVHVTAPNGTMVAMTPETANAQGGDGKITVSIPNATPGVWTIGVECTDAGDQVVNAGPLGPLPGPASTAGGSADTGNAWTLASSYQA